MICPQCGKLISVGEEKCPFCGAWRPGLYGYAPVMQRWFARGFDLTAMISTTCVVLYIASLVLQPEAIFQFRGLFSILSPGSRALYQLGMTGGVAWDQGWWWTLLTAIYLHGGLLHIVFNVMWIRSLGPNAIDVFGPARAFIIFSVAGAVGFLVSNFATQLTLGQPTPSIGASGSIFGLLASLIVYARKRGGAMLSAQLWQWALIMFVMGFLMSGVNNWAHAGGFAGGWLAAQVMPFASDRREGRLAMIMALALIGVTAAGFVLSFFQVTRILLHH